MLFDRAEEIMTLRPEIVVEGFERAKEEIQFAGSTSRADVGAMLNEQIAQTESRAQQTGLYNTSVPTEDSRGAYFDAVRNLSAINEGVGQQYAQLELGQSQAEANAQTDLAQFLMHRYGEETRLNETKLAIWANHSGIATPQLPSAGAAIAADLQGRFDYAESFGSGGDATTSTLGIGLI